MARAENLGPFQLLHCAMQSDTCDTEAQRAQLLLELAAYEPADSLETTMLAQTVEFIARESRCFERETLEGHCTASAWIINADATASAMVFHKKFERWVQPGGHADGDGNLRRVALREAYEETSLTSLRLLQKSIFDLHIFANPNSGFDRPTYHFDIRYVFYADQHEPPISNHESREAAWIPFDQFHSASLDESVLRLMRKVSLWPTRFRAK